MSDASPHDRFFKAIFSRLDVLADTVRRVLDPALVAAIDWDRIELLPTEYIGGDLVAGRSDLLLKAQFAGHEGFICVLVEHQSSIDRWMAWRVMVYVGRIWEHWRREHPRARRLPAVVPVVLYHGRRPWPETRRLAHLLDVPPALRDVVARHLPDLTLLVDDLRRQDDAEIERSTRAALATLALLLLKHGRHTADLLPHLERWIGYMVEVAESPGGVEALTQALYYTYGVSDLEPGAIERRLIPRLAPASQEEIMTTAERLRREGEARGVARGREEGMEAGIATGVARGRLEGQALLVRQQLHFKFRELPEDLDARLAAADAETLTRWGLRILDATRLDDVFRG